MNNTIEHPNNIVLVTRPKEDAASLLEILDRRGYTSLSSPLLKINHITPPTEFPDWLAESQALVLTSANGVRALTSNEKHKHTYIRLPIYAVGDATAREARDAGFNQIETAAGDVDKLADLIKKKLNPENGPVTHIAGSKLAGDLANLLEKNGFTYHRATLYDSIKATNLSIDVIEALANARVRCVLFYSPRTAESFSALVEKANLGETLKTVTAICLSQNVAAKLKHQNWLDIQTAKQPTQNDLLTLLDALMTDTPSNDDQENNNYDNLLSDYSAEEIIDGFGGIRPMAGKVGVAVSTVQGWKTRNHIPESHKDQIIKAAIEEKATFNKSEKVNEEKDSPIIEGEIVDTSDQDTNTTANHSSDISDAEPVIIKKHVSTFSLISIAALTGALILQPYWSPTVEKALNPLLSNLAPNLAAAKNENAVEGKIEEAIAPLQERLKQLQTALSTAIQSSSDNAISEESVSALISNELSSVSNVIAGLQKQVDAIPIITETADGTSIDLSPLNEAIQNLQNQVDQVNNLITDTQLNLEDKLLQLQDDVSSYKASLEDLADMPSKTITAPNGNQQSIAVLIGVMEMSDALQKGRPLESYISTLQKLATAQDEILVDLNELERLSEDGVPTLYQLQRAYSEVAANPEAHRTDAGETEWMDATLNNLQNLISVRRVGEDENAPPISRAEIALQRGDLSAAITILAPLSTERQDVADWIQAATKLDQAETYLARIRQTASNAILGNPNMTENNQ
ncbi:uroporphyrinogen-III synthase [Curvivirga aplysinae]|uniref:uroporphyrinogen-III synthase n=1 Tax=Curvivirga aplysinae TaxID=2529852 RepID=UPI0012BBB310|nr:uroporphyrinogen-III synthase [Curvivirga aplysinae]